MTNFKQKKKNNESVKSVRFLHRFLAIAALSSFAICCVLFSSVQKFGRFENDLCPTTNIISTFQNDDVTQQNIPLFMQNKNTRLAQETSLNQKYVVTANKAVLFETASFSSQKLTELQIGTKVEIEFEDENAKKYENNGFIFYKAIHENLQGYILSDLVTPDSTQIESVPNFNAKTNATCNVFTKVDGEFQMTKIQLQKGEKIFLYEGFNKNVTYTAISFLQNNEIKYGYIETKNINPNGINPMIISCFVIILAILGIIFAWLFIKNRKTKKGTRIKNSKVSSEEVIIKNK